MTNYILFDFDGVIVNSFSAAFGVHKLICPAATEDDYRKAFEGNINDWQMKTVKHDERCRHDLDFFAEYIPRMKKIELVAGMSEVIEKLSKSYSLIVISSTLSAPIGELLEKYKLASFFQEIMGNDVHTSKVEKMKIFFAKYKTDAQHCLFITDTLGDMREGAKVNVSAVGVTWGFHDKERLVQGKPVAIVESPEELVGVVEKYFAGVK
ncbi:MAG: HAD-IA family hydrolase [Candidatus Paceibacterota bacterium]